MKRTNVPIVFIVENDQDFRIFYAETLINEGVNIIGYAKHGKNSIRMLKSLLIKPDIIIIDLNISLNFGFQTARDILKFDKNAKIIFINGDESVKDKAFRVGAISFLLKSFKYTDLIVEIKHIFNRL